MNTYEITLFDKNGKRLDQSFTVEHDGQVGRSFKEYWTMYARMFLNNLTKSIEVTLKHQQL